MPEADVKGFDRLLVWAIDETSGFDTAWVRVTGTPPSLGGSGGWAPAHPVLDDLLARDRR